MAREPLLEEFSITREKENTLGINKKSRGQVSFKAEHVVARPVVFVVVVVGGGKCGGGGGFGFVIVVVGGDCLGVLWLLLRFSKQIHWRQT